MTTPLALTVPDLLDSAAEILTRRGLHRGGYRPDRAYEPNTGALWDTCPVDVMAAISIAADENRASGPSMNTLPALVALAEHLGFNLAPFDADWESLAGAVVGMLGDWNDRVVQSVEVAAAAVRGAASGERRRDAGLPPADTAPAQGGAA